MAAQDDAAAVELHEVTVLRGSLVALRDVSATIARGSMTAICGRNGAGKSTLLDLVAGRLRAARGTAHVHPTLRGRMAYLPQRERLERHFPITVGDATALGLWPRTGAWAAASAAQRAEAQRALALVGLADLAQRRVGELSAGQLQRLLFARVALQDARLVLLDEPLAAVDDETSHLLLRVMRQWQARGCTIVAAMHDPAHVGSGFTHRLVLDHGHASGTSPCVEPVRLHSAPVDSPHA